MANWTTADIAILCVAAFVAVTSLVRLMLHRRDELVRELHDEAQQAKMRSSATVEPAAKK
ncbi:MAG TPA: hypothetical protein VJ809_06340 [Pirellulales bacterium]|jgi:hypothetical protein|nr:hypothetical protein [Pirellulales bacterium]